MEFWWTNRWLAEYLGNTYASLSVGEHYRCAFRGCAGCREGIRQVRNTSASSAEMSRRRGGRNLRAACQHARTINPCISIWPMAARHPGSISMRRISIRPLSLVWFPKEYALPENTHVPRNRESYTLHNDFVAYCSERFVSLCGLLCQPFNNVRE